jgi:asparagine synthase (glutamine-hydrolysing)
MTVLAGALALKPGVVLTSIADEIRQSISRHPGDNITEFRDEHSFLAKIDVGAYGVPAYISDGSGNVSLLAGEPLLRMESEDVAADRSADLAVLHAQWSQSDWSGLRHCTGTFAAVHYDPTAKKIWLVSDKVGVRPLYYWVGQEVVIFASALRILEQVRAIPLKMDLRGTTEIAVFKFPLAERTGYAGITRIGSGQVVELSADGIKKTHYWRWDRLPPPEGNLSQVAKLVHHRFLVALRRRIRGQRIAIAFLSGGLDSRSIVAGLVDLGTHVHALNFAGEGTQDRVFAERIARALGTEYHQFNADPPAMYKFRGRAYNEHLVSTLLSSHPELKSLPRIIWSGDGGSCGVGHVYLNQEIVQLARSGDTDKAIAAFLEYNEQGVQTGILQPEAAKDLVDIPRQGIREELERLDCTDRGRAFHLFVMVNDQRRHLANFFENIDVDRLEFQLPFFDADFLEPILSSPIVGFLKHEFYMKWLDYFPPVTVSQPWQAYPGHVPCPLPVSQDLRYQWGDGLYTDNFHKQAREALVRDTSVRLQSPEFPDTVIRKRRLQIANWLTQFGIRNYDYLLEMAAVYCRYSGGRSALN